MKTISYITIALVIGLGIVAPCFVHAENPPLITQSVPADNDEYVKAFFSITKAPSQTTKVFLILRDDNENKRIKEQLLMEVTPTTAVPSDFNVTFNFQTLGIQSGKQYRYFLADSLGESFYFLTTPKCFDSNGPKECSYSIPNQTTPSNGDDYYYGQVVSPTTLNPTTNATTQATVPVTPSTPTTPTSPNSPTNPANPTTTYQAPPQTFGGISVTFSRESQIITETSAEIHGIVSALITIPVELSFVSGAAGNPLGNEQLLFTTVLNPGQTKPITMKFTGLNAGSSYYFVLKNKKTNTSSRAIYFTTPGGATNERARFAGLSLTGNEAPPDIVFEDTVSEGGIVPKCGRTAGSEVPIGETRMCTFNDFMQLIANIINYALIILGPIIAIFLMYTGVMIIIYGKKADPTGAAMDKLRKYKERLVMILVGVAVIFFAWTFIATILRELGVKPNYIMLDLFSGN